MANNDHRFFCFLKETAAELELGKGRDDTYVQTSSRCRKDGISVKYPDKCGLSQRFFRQFLFFFLRKVGGYVFLEREIF